MEAGQIILAIFTSNGLLAFVTYMITRHDRIKREKEKGIDAGTIRNFIELTIAMTQDRIVYMAKKHIERGCITFQDKDELRELADAYFAVGGNHRGEAYWNKVDGLPIVKAYVEEERN